MNENLISITESVSVNFADYIRQKKNITKLHIGDPDFKTHPNILIESTKTLNSDRISYGASRGLKSLRNELSFKLLNENNIFTNPDENILITHGAVHAVNIAIKAILNQGDECIIIEPYWLAYRNNVILAGGKPIIIKNNGKFDLDVDEIKKYINKKTKLIIINSPNNPSGSVYNKLKLKELGKIAKENNLFVLSDEVYESIVFDKNVHYSIASEASCFNNIISVFSFSKKYSMTGWRVGYLVAAKEILNNILKLSQFSITCMSIINQKAALSALKDPEVNIYANHMRKEYERRKNLILNCIKDTWIESNIYIPSGTFYMLINISKFNLSSLDFVKNIVDNYKVSFTPGIAFGQNMDSFIRLCYVCSDDDIKIAVNALININKKICH